jgi:hypothetical protein
LASGFSPSLQKGLNKKDVFPVSQIKKSEIHHKAKRNLVAAVKRLGYRYVRTRGGWKKHSSARLNIMQSLLSVEPSILSFLRKIFWNGAV